MNPATPGPLTILLVPPPGDTALLADEAGGVVPQTQGYACNDEAHGLWWALSERSDAPICEVCSAHKRWQEGRALVLVLDGAPVAMGCDRAARWVHAKAGGHSPTIGPKVEQEWTAESARMVADYAGLFRGARVVLLRDGREVQS
jgi:hypothetical protein